MKRRNYFNLAMLCTGLISSALYGVEGMWQPEQLPEISKDLKAKGLALDPQSLKQLSAFPMNAIVSLGGCSASFVSELGLVVTNHHCAYGSIQYNSSEKQNLLRDGFYAKTASEELPAAPGSRIFVTESIQDVTQDLLKGLDKTQGLARFEAIDQRRKDLISLCEKTPGYRCRIDAFFGDSSYRLTKQLEIKDVRLVQAPPSAIGNFGDDIDNWMWPRHTGDFSFYRAYVDSKGFPAEYSKDNVPYQPKGHLKIDSKGIDEGSFVMVLGYPGRTNRHRVKEEVRHNFEVIGPETKAYLDKKIALIEEFKAKDPKVGIQYATQLAGMNNASKNIEGKQTGYEAMGLLKTKEADEKAFVESLKKSKNLAAIARYNALQKLIAEDQQEELTGLVFRKSSDSELLKSAQRLYRLSREKEKADEKREVGFQNRDLAQFKESMIAQSRRFDPKVDEALWQLGLRDSLSAAAEIKAKLPKAARELLVMPEEKRNAALAEFYKTSILADEKQRLALMDADRKVFEQSKDPFIQLAVSLYDEALAIEKQGKDRNGRFQELRSAYMKDLKSYFAKNGKVLYPDANSTLRISYGTVQGYKNRKNENFTPFTKLEEIAAKNTGKEPFDVPEKQMELIAKKSYGSYEHAGLKTVPVNFLADLDITGGNSGSATLNAKGEFTGIVFDGTIDGVISDWAFDPAYTRSIHVDVRYMLWVLDKVSGAERLLKEMGARTQLSSIR